MADEAISMQLIKCVMFRRETMPRLIKTSRPVRRTGSFGAKQQQQHVGSGRPGQLTQTANQESQAESVNQSEPEADQASAYTIRGGIRKSQYSTVYLCNKTCGSFRKSRMKRQRSSSACVKNFLDLIRLRFWITWPDPKSFHARHEDEGVGEITCTCTYLV